MLVLSRHAGESLVIGDGITVRILSIRGDTIKIGIDAPRDIAVHRSEVLDAVRAANTAATHEADSQLPGWLPTSAPNPKKDPAL